MEGDDSLGRAILHALAQASGAVVSADQGCAMAAFASGMGDGTYDTWLGRDARGEPAMLLTDFAILASEEHVAAVHASWALRKAKKWWEFWK